MNYKREDRPDLALHKVPSDVIQEKMDLNRLDSRIGFRTFRSLGVSNCLIQRIGLVYFEHRRGLFLSFPFLPSVPSPLFGRFPPVLLSSPDFYLICRVCVVRLNRYLPFPVSFLLLLPQSSRVYHILKDIV